jgi:hypothetical protein
MNHRYTPRSILDHEEHIIGVGAAADGAERRSGEWIARCQLAEQLSAECIGLRWCFDRLPRCDQPHSIGSRRLTTKLNCRRK